jgi:hypothetical protein
VVHANKRNKIVNCDVIKNFVLKFSIFYESVQYIKMKCV